MRLFVAAAFALLPSFLVLSCTVHQDDCRVNPLLDCPDEKDTGGNTGAGAGATMSSVGGGTGGGACVIDDCPMGDTCKERACVGGECGFNPVNEGMTCGVSGATGLVCEGGVCSGCENKEDCGTPPECQAYECKVLGGATGGKVCGLVATPGERCNGDIGSCSAEGACGNCDDGVKNGAETGVDCGAGTPGCGECSGDPCAARTECKSGFCVDGVCCDSACDGGCEACGADGQCSPIAVGTNDPDFPACDTKGGCGAVEGWCACEDGLKNGTETDVDCGGACGAACTVGQQCTTGDDCTSEDGTVQHDCVDGFCCDSACDGDCEGCSEQGREGVCSSLLGAQDQCPANKACNGDFACALTVGQPCTQPAQCATNLCKQNVCTWCDPANDPCTSSKVCVSGHCLNKNADAGEFCVDNEQCGGNLFCIDGVCCGDCDQTCMACNFAFTGQFSGTCAFVIGGTDPQNDCPVPSAPVCNGNGECGPAN